MPESSSLAKVTGPVALRALAHAFRNFSDFDGFVKGLQVALNQSDHFERLILQIDRDIVETPAIFSRKALTLPLSGGNGQFGTLQVTPGGERKQFGPEDLHLMAGLADFLSAALAQAINLEDAARRRELLRFLLNQAPIGIAAYGENKRLIVANDLANRWLTEAGIPFEDLKKNPGGFHLRAGGKLIFGEARLMADEASGSWIVVLHDLTSEQARLLELIKRETYRAIVETRRIGFAFVESPQVKNGIIGRLPAIREALLPGEAVGPYDARRAGLIFPDLPSLALRARLRTLGAIIGDLEGLKIGYSELGRHGRTPETLLEAALQCAEPYNEILRSVVLVHDDSAAVADTFAMVLGKEFRVVKSTSAEHTRRLLDKETFEGFVTEMELRNGVSGMELVRYAQEKQPGIRPFFTTVQRAPYALPAGASETEALILEKPFNIATLTNTVRTKLLG